jgi:hypothetical protein
MVGGVATHVKYRCGGRFFGRRVNCEHVPLLPSWAVARMLDDPRKIPYLLIWKNSSDGTVQEAVRIAPYYEKPGLGGLDWTGAVEIERHDRTRSFIRTLLRPLPRNGAQVRLLICPYCQTPRRALYGWQPGGQYTSSAVTCSWQCRSCAGLRYVSEGEALVFRSRWAFARLIEQRFGGCRSPRPERWLPYVFTSPEEAAEAGCGLVVQCAYLI